MARTSIAKKEILEDKSGVRFTFSDGQVVEVGMANLSDEIKIELCLHGISQKVGDSYSGEKDIAVAFAKAANVLKRLVAGDWKAIREGGGSKISDLAKALSVVQGVKLAEAVDVISGLDAANKKGLRNHPKILAEMARISAERAAKKAEDAADSDDAVFDLTSL